MASAKHLFVVVRLDEPVDPAYWKESFKLLRVFSDPDTAETEAERLRVINGPEKCTYEVHTAISAIS
jgi:hypothetical protein